MAEKVIARFCYLDDDVIELTQTGKSTFNVGCERFDRTLGFTTEYHVDLDLRTARIEFEKFVNLAVCRMTLDRLYTDTGIERPKGTGKYGL